MFLSRTATRGHGHFGESGFWKPHTLTYHRAKFQKLFILCRIVSDSSSAMTILFPTATRVVAIFKEMSSEPT